MRALVVRRGRLQVVSWAALAAFPDPQAHSVWHPTQVRLGHLPKRDVPRTTLPSGSKSVPCPPWPAMMCPGPFADDDGKTQLLGFGTPGLLQEEPTQRPAENNWKRSSNRDFCTSPPRGGRKSRIRGRSKKSFQARTWPVLSLAYLALSASESVIHIADRYAPWRNLGVDFITQTCVTKSSSTLTKSNDANASRKTL